MMTSHVMMNRNTMPMRYLGLIVVALSPLLALSVTWSIACAQELEAIQVVPIDKVQSMLRDLVEAGVVVSSTKPETSERYEQLVREIQSEVGGDKNVLLRQWLYCLKEYVLAQEGERRSDLAMAMQYLLEKFDIAPSDMAYALFPLLDSPDEKLRRLTEKYLVWSHKVYGEAGVDFRTYESILKERLESSGDIPASLVKYMYERAPGDALISMMNLDQDSFGVLKSALDISEDKSRWPLSNRRILVLKDGSSTQEISTALERLSTRPEWWVQLFVAEFVAQAPEVNKEAIQANLARSDHSLVKEVLSNPNKYAKSGARQPQQQKVEK